MPEEGTRIRVSGTVKQVKGRELTLDTTLSRDAEKKSGSGSSS